MNGMPLKQQAALAVLGMIVLYAVVFAMWFLNLDRKMMWCPESWGKAIRKYQAECENYRKECKLIGEKSHWEEAYETEKKAMPMFEEGKATDTTWQRKLDELAEKHHVSIAQRQAGAEVQAGEVFELPIEVKSWEGALESLVGLMHELENTDDGMFDIRSISIKPNTAKKGYLKGSFVLTCAYMHGTPDDEE